MHEKLRTGVNFGPVPAVEKHHTIAWHDVESSHIARIAFVRTGVVPATEGHADRQLGIVLVEFSDGHAYGYHDVLRSTFNAVLHAESVGRAFNLLVKDRGKWKKLR